MVKNSRGVQLLAAGAREARLEQPDQALWPHSRTCIICGRNFPYKPPGGPPKTCSQKCWRKHDGHLQRERERDKKRRSIPCKSCAELVYCTRAQKGDPDYQPMCQPCRRKRMFADCEHCGREYKRHPGRRTDTAERLQKYCSPACYKAALKERPTRNLTCEYCHKEFPLKYGNYGQRFCSKDCQRWGVRKKHNTELDWHQCPCSNWICRPRKKYCSSRCAATAAKARTEARTKIRRRGELNEIIPEWVFESNNWRCGICHKKVDHRLRYPHPMSASVDHIVPISRGGEHAYTNVHCTHLRCNLAKNNRGGGEQLMLLDVIQQPAAKPWMTRKKKGARVCTVNGCGKPHVGKGFCRSHYNSDYGRRRKSSTAK